MRNKELIAEMQKEINALKEKTDKLSKVAYWLEKHDRNDVVFDIVIWKIHQYPRDVIRYFYNGEIKTADLGYADSSLPQLVKNGEQTIVVCDKCRDKYFQIDKATATVTEIPKPEMDDDIVPKSKVDILEEYIANISKTVDYLSKRIKCQTTLSQGIADNSENLELHTAQFKVAFNEIKAIKDVVEFTNLYGADNLHIWRDILNGKLVVSYLYENKKHEVKYDFIFNNGKLPICIKNGDIAILEYGEKYYQLDKEKETIVEIPKPAFVAEKKSKANNGEKSNKKTSAEMAKRTARVL